MDKREKVLLAFSKCLERSSGCLNEPECPYVPQCFGPDRHAILPIDLIEDIRALLKDAVPVVRCKDCVCGLGPDENGWYMCSNTGGGYPADGYCSDGERRNEDESEG